jgi:hypothetical protein
MEDLFLCPDCRELHDEPAEAIFGHLIRCLDCELAAELTWPAFDTAALPYAA